MSRVVGTMVQHRSPPPAPLSLRNTVNEGVLGALHRISRRLTESRIRHAVIGGLAVGVYGWPRSTRDIDLLLGEEAWQRMPSGELIPRIALPEVVDEVPIDYLPLDVAGGFLEVAFERPVWSDGIPVAPVEVVACTKLLRLAMRDQADIVEMLKARSMDRDQVREFLAQHTPMLVDRWDALVAQADAEHDRRH